MHIGIVSLSSRIKPSDLMSVSAAIQKQVTRDFGPIWEIQATVAAFSSLADVPSGYWHVLIVEDDDRLPRNAGGVHLDEHGQPFSLVRAKNGWGLTTSHEVLEMLADPFGNRRVAGESPAESQGRVEFLVEVCDPCESADFAYTVDGIFVSDFYTPKYFDPVASSSASYSYTSAITEPREVLSGGYLSWFEPTSSEWFQLANFENGPEIVSLGRLSMEGSMRATIDRLTNARSDNELNKSMSSIDLSRAKQSTNQIVEPNRKPYAAAHNANAESLMREIEKIMQGSINGGQASVTKLRRPPKKGK